MNEKNMLDKISTFSQHVSLLHLIKNVSRFDEVFLSGGYFPLADCIPCFSSGSSALYPPINDVSHSGGARFQLRFHCPMLCWGFANSIVLIPH